MPSSGASIAAAGGCTGEGRPGDGAESREAEDRGASMLHTRICDLLEIEHPIISAPMAGAAGAELAAAVSAAGGFGLIAGTTPEGPEGLRARIRAARERTDRPFGVGFISSFPGLEELVQVALKERVAAV